MSEQIERISCCINVLKEATIIFLMNAAHNLLTSIENHVKSNEKQIKS